MARLFIHYLTATTVEVARAKGRTKLTLQDVLDALNRIDFGDLVEGTASDVAQLAEAAERGKKRRAEGLRAAAAKRAADSSDAAGAAAGGDDDEGDEATDDRDGEGEGEGGDDVSDDDDEGGETEAKRQKMMDALLSA